MTETSLPSPELLRKLLRYEPDTGKLFWLPRDDNFFLSSGAAKRWNNKYANNGAFLTNLNGYRSSEMFEKTFYAHRVIWAMQTNKWPDCEIDHIDRDRTNNIWTNLRLASTSQNRANKQSKPNSTSKYLGVCWMKKDKKWRAQIRKNKKDFFLGDFVCEIEAAKAYDAKAKELHGEFANLNFPEVFA